MSYRGRGRGGGYNNQYNNRNNFSQQAVDDFVQQNSVGVEILGWNGASPEECINFISRKCKIVVSNHSVEPNTGILKGYVKSMNQANDLLNWSGVKFAGQSLRITKAASADSFSSKMGVSNPNTGNAIEALSHFLKSRYQPEIKLLNLSAVKQDPTVNAGGFFNSNSTSSKFFPALMKVATDLKLDVVSVDLSGNELQDLSTVSTLAQTFPTLQNLSLVNNNFSRVKSFEIWKNKLNYLRELLLVGNPINDGANGNGNVKIDLMKIFPRLVVLNGEIIRNEQALKINLTFPFGTPASMFFQDEEIQNMAPNFIANYFKLWDSNRSELMILYQNESQFSMQVDSSHPHLIETNANASYASGTDFGYYIPQSRNLTRVSSAKVRASRVATGPEAIFKLFSQLPKTRHDLMTKPELFSMESYRYPQLGGIMITIHGSFEEVAQPDNLDALNTNGPRGRFNNNKKKIPLSKKSFDRTFVVIPGPNGGMIVASDLLSVRNFSGTDAWNMSDRSVSAPASNVPTPQSTTPVPGAGAPGAPGAPTPTTADLPPEIKSSFNQIQQEVLVKILLETKLNLQYGVMLCEQSNWDYQQCTINFKNSVATLPREAYL
ncbi:NTF2-like protein [Suhomyces tanzawaensis NRRL Y-17324]|uniref:NTF2-like protein n=1 Tax=Suhomyces tanzawaensis NRRL Y-17324 TaxID=984487 RepID=A0A1E4SKD0_9ASCO|nr:NTF2-like protein [Suhomyces tanzawaensis NRRL Y-17324]ODV79961.1 NTF2-like protein [Suhomyces tanzawaensis NRRL Y-17324]